MEPSGADPGFEAQVIDLLERVLNLDSAAKRALAESLAKEVTLLALFDQIELALLKSIQRHPESLPTGQTVGETIREWRSIFNASLMEKYDYLVGLMKKVLRESQYREDQLAQIICHIFATGKPCVINVHYISEARFAIQFFFKLIHITQPPGQIGFSVRIVPKSQRENIPFGTVFYLQKTRP